MLRYRLLLGAVFVVGMAVVCWLDVQQFADLPPGGWLFPLAMLLCVAASGEMLWLFEARGVRPLSGVVYGGNLAIVAANAFPLFFADSLPTADLGPLGYALLTMALATIAAFVGEIFRYRQPGRAIADLGAAILSFAYVGMLFTFLIHLRLIGENLVGMAALVSLVAIVKMGDTGAYTLGRLFGRHKMTPLLSPGKTWEGAAGAMLFAVIASAAVFVLWLPNLSDSTRPHAILPAWRWTVYGVLIATVGMLGDLAESLIKRDAGRKDSSAWMPGFGGVLDVLDSILLAAPIAYGCWVLGLVW